MIPVIYESYNIARSPMLFGDQVMLKHILDQYEDFETVIGFNSSFDGGIINISLHHNEQYIDNLNADISSYKWVLIILTSNEYASDAYKKIKHLNMKIWLQTPKAEDKADRFLPLGFPSIIKPRYVNKKYDWFFSGQINHVKRIELYKQLQKMQNGKLLKTEGFNQGYDYGEYLKLMAQSRIIPCPSGPETPDTYRLYEALELGCIPVVDNEWYWKKIFGDFPFKAVENWSELPAIIEEELKDYYLKAQDIANWWGDQKTLIEDNLFNDIEELKANV